MNAQQEARAIEALTWIVKLFKWEQEQQIDPPYANLGTGYSPELQDAIDLLGELKS